MNRRTKQVTMTTSLDQFFCMVIEVFHVVQLKHAVDCVFQVGLTPHIVTEIAQKEIRRRHEFFSCTCLVDLFKVGSISVVCIICRLYRLTYHCHLSVCLFLQIYSNGCVGQLQHIFVRFSVRSTTTALQSLSANAVACLAVAAPTKLKPSCVQQ